MSTHHICNDGVTGEEGSECMYLLCIKQKVMEQGGEGGTQRMERMVIWEGGREGERKGREGEKEGGGSKTLEHRSIIMQLQDT